jgi:hypothetical protein
MAQLNFNARAVEPQSGFETLPLDWYKLVADESSIEPTKKGDGSYLKVRFSIIEGLATGTKLQGRKTYKQFNLQNPNQQAVDIGLKQLSALCHAVGVLDCADSQMLHNIPFWGRVKIRPAEAGSQYDDQNDITSFKHISDPPAAVAAAAGATPPGGFAPPPGGYAPPNQWSAPPAPPPNAAPPGYAPPAQPWSQPGAPAAGAQPPNGYAPPTYAAPGATAPGAAGAPPAGAGSPPAAWTPPAGGQPWQHQPPQGGAAPPAPPTPPQPPHPAQNAAPPWHQPPRQ